MHSVNEDTGLPAEGQHVFDLSNVLSVEGRPLLLCLLLAKGLLDGNDNGLQAIHMGACERQAKIGILEYVAFLKSLFPETRVMFACSPPFPERYLGMFQTVVLDKRSLAYLGDRSVCQEVAAISEGELVFMQGSRMVSFFYDRQDMKGSMERQEKPSMVEDRTVTDKRLAKRILETLSKFDDVTKTGIVQSLSIDFPPEMVEFVLEELISLGYVLAEVKKSRTGLTTKLAISMGGRSWLVKGEGGE
jgi:hypothetical protein